MPGRYLNHRARGHRITIDEWNSMVDVNNFVAPQIEATGKEDIPDTATDRQSGVLLIENKTGTDIEPGEAIGLSEVALSSVSDFAVERVRNFLIANEIALAESTPLDATQHSSTRLGIALERLPDQESGQVIVSGFAIAKVHLEATWHRHCGTRDTTSGKLKSKPAHGFGIFQVESPPATGDRWCLIRLVEEVGLNIVSGLLQGDLTSGGDAIIAPSGVPGATSIAVYDDDMIPAGQKLAGGVKVRALWQDNWITDPPSNTQYGGYVVINANACPVDV